MSAHWRSRKVLVTGADGFIGSHLTSALLEAGAEVTALSFYNAFDSYGWLSDLEDSPETLRLVRGDIRDAAQTRQLIQGQEFVFHLAALISIPYSYDAPSSYVDTNVHGTLNVLTAAREAGVRRVIHTSTSEVYGTARYTPITEAHPLHAQSPYAASKAAADLMAEAFYLSFDVPVVTLRPFNTFGPRQSQRAVISSVIRQMLDDNCPDIRVGNLTPKRDFNFVSDTVAAFMALGQADASVIGHVFNAGSGVMVTIGDVVQRIKRIAGSDKPVVQEQSRVRPAPSELLELMADADTLHRATGWTTRVTLDEGLARTIDWWRSRPGRARSRERYMT